MRYSWKEGVDRHEENIQYGLLMGLPFAFLALVLGPMKMSSQHTPTVHTPPRVTTAALMHRKGHSKLALDYSFYRKVTGWRF